MESFNQVKNSVLKVAKDARDTLGDVAQEAEELVMEVADRFRGREPAQGRVDALALLHNDHATMEALLAELDSALNNAGSAQSIEGLFTQFKYEFDTHNDAEAKLFYGALERAVARDIELRAQLRRVRAGDARIRRMLDDMAGTIATAQSRPWRTRFRTLENAFLRHVQYVENDLFRLAQQAFTAQQLQLLGGSMYKQQQSATQMGKTGRTGQSRRIGRTRRTRRSVTRTTTRRTTGKRRTRRTTNY